jgi:hypothetical protein
MSADWTPPGHIKRFWVERRARKYHDPIQKLAYLQRAADRGTEPCIGGRKSLRWCLLLAVITLLFVGARMQTITDVNAGFLRDTPTSKTSEVKSVPSAAPKVNPLDAAWLVEYGKDHEIYSNGLRIETRYCRPNQPRSYVIFRNGVASERRSKAAGIVFHTTESAQAPFTADQNDDLTRFGRNLLDYVSQKQAYHYMIDRFGRVFRIVPETDSANHAGNSVWAYQDEVYLNLNHSFLGVAFEAHTQDLYEGCYLNPSQIHSGHLLVEILVSKYQIPLSNCITHAQVSVDPNGMNLGFHTDGSGNFPFQELGLPNNYELPIPSLFVFGFDFDSRLLSLTGTRMWKGLLLADERLRRTADSQQLSIGQYKEILRGRYRTSMAKLKALGIIKEN